MFYLSQKGNYVFVFFDKAKQGIVSHVTILPSVNLLRQKEFDLTSLSIPADKGVSEARLVWRNTLYFMTRSSGSEYGRILFYDITKGTVILNIARATNPNCKLINSSFRPCAVNVL